MLNEYEYQLFEQQEIRRDVQLRKELDFVRQIKGAIWNCFEGGIPAAVGEDVGKPGGPK
jgi:hypothetical protein